MCVPTIMIRVVIIYFFVILAIRIMGKRQIGDLQPGELVVTILISDLAAAPLCDPEYPLLYGIVPVAMLVALEYLVSEVVLKSLTVRRLMNGHSAVIIRNGTVDQTLLKKLRLSVDDLMEMLRGQSVFDISTVAYGVLETNGTLSVLLKAEYENATAKDVKAEKPETAMPVPLVTDGRLRREEMEFAHLTEMQVNDILAKQNLKRREVFLLTVDGSGNTVAIKKERHR